jgi:hypothetical protein
MGQQIVGNRHSRRAQPPTARSRMSPGVCKRTLLPIIFIGGHLDERDDLANVRRTLATYHVECR